MSFSKKQTKRLQFFSDGCSVITFEHYLKPFKKVTVFENDFKKFKDLNKNEKKYKFSYRTKFF